MDRFPDYLHRIPLKKPDPNTAQKPRLSKQRTVNQGLSTQVNVKKAVVEKPTRQQRSELINGLIDWLKDVGSKISDGVQIIRKLAELALKKNKVTEAANQVIKIFDGFTPEEIEAALLNLENVPQPELGPAVPFYLSLYEGLQDRKHLQHRQPGPLSLEVSEPPKKLFFEERLVAAMKDYLDALVQGDEATAAKFEQLIAIIVEEGRVPFGTVHSSIHSSIKAWAADEGRKPEDLVAIYNGADQLHERADRYPVDEVYTALLSELGPGILISAALDGDDDKIKAAAVRLNRLCDNWQSLRVGEAEVKEILAGELKKRALNTQQKQTLVENLLSKSELLTARLLRQLVEPVLLQEYLELFLSRLENNYADSASVLEQWANQYHGSGSKLDIFAIVSNYTSAKSAPELAKMREHFLALRAGPLESKITAEVSDIIDSSLLGISQQAIQAARLFVYWLDKGVVPLANESAGRLEIVLQNECKSKNLDYEKIVEELLLIELRKLGPAAETTVGNARILLGDTNLVGHLRAAMEKSGQKQF